MSNVLPFLLCPGLAAADPISVRDLDRFPAAVEVTAELCRADDYCKHLRARAHIEYWRREEFAAEEQRVEELKKAWCYLNLAHYNRDTLCNGMAAGRLNQLRGCIGPTLYRHGLVPALVPAWWRER